MPSHALATIAVCEAAAISRDKQWQPDCPGNGQFHRRHARRRRRVEQSSPSWQRTFTRISEGCGKSRSPARCWPPAGRSWPCARHRWADVRCSRKDVPKGGRVPQRHGSHQRRAEQERRRLSRRCPRRRCDPLLATLFGTCGRMFLAQAAPDTEKADWRRRGGPLPSARAFPARKLGAELLAGHTRCVKRIIRPGTSGTKRCATI